MNYAVITCVNGNFSVASEHGDNKKQALMAFHDRCKILWNAEDAKEAIVKLVGNDLDAVDGKLEHITHE